MPAFPHPRHCTPARWRLGQVQEANPPRRAAPRHRVMSRRTRPAAASRVTSASPFFEPCRAGWRHCRERKRSSNRAADGASARPGAAHWCRSARPWAWQRCRPRRSAHRARPRAAASRRSRDWRAASVSTSFIECTAASIRPSSSQASSSLVHSALPPISASGRSCTLSPLASTGTSSTSASCQPCAAHSRARASSRLCQCKRRTARAEADARAAGR